MRRTFLLFLLAAAAAAAFFAWRATRGIDAPRAPVQADVTTAKSSTSKSPTTSPSARSAVVPPPPASDGEPVDTRPLEDRGAKVPDEPVLAAQYDGWTKAKLEEQLTALELDYAKEFDKACDQRFEARQYRVLDEQELEGVDPAYDVLSAYDKEGVLMRVRTVALPEKSEPGGPPAELQVEHQLVSLPPDLYPELYRRRTELAWLRAKVAAAKDSEDPP